MTIDDIAFGGEGVGRVDDFVAFVPFVALGEVVEVERGQGESLPVNIPAAQARFFQQVCRAGGHVIAVLNPREVLNESKI